MSSYVNKVNVHCVYEVIDTVPMTGHERTRKEDLHPKPYFPS